VCGRGGNYNIPDLAGYPTGVVKLLANYYADSCTITTVGLMRDDYASVSHIKMRVPLIGISVFLNCTAPSTNLLSMEEEDTFCSSLVSGKYKV
jgi:hypothetical protein